MGYLNRRHDPLHRPTICQPRGTPLGGLWAEDELPNVLVGSNEQTQNKPVLCEERNSGRQNGANGADVQLG